jgi:hypothetical protein
MNATLPKFERDQRVWVHPHGRYTQGFTARVIESGSDEFGDFVRINTGDQVPPDLLTAISED